jgi:hypothetical protein
MGAVTPTADQTAPSLLAPDEWRSRRSGHEQRIDRLLDDHLARRARNERHPVEDFLFTYYSYRPAQLRRWHPGVGVVLVGATAADFGTDYRSPEYRDTGDNTGVTVDLDAVLARRRESVTWIRDLLVATASRPAYVGCFGMHEWAMLYRAPQQEVRHQAYPLRLGAEGTNALVEETKVRCGHFDAFRFFTPPARTLNQLQPTRETQLDNEQPGCLHANMDVYRWAFKLSPLVPAELVADCFELAREIRVVDMRASPYDLAALGYEPVRVETADGRAEYVHRQRGFAERAGVLRKQLIDCCERALPRLQVDVAAGGPGNLDEIVLPSFHPIHAVNSALRD